MNAGAEVETATMLFIYSPVNSARRSRWRNWLFVGLTGYTSRQSVSARALRGSIYFAAIA